MAQGWIKLGRELCDHWLWQDRPFSKGQAWVDLIMMANHKDTKIHFDGKLVSVKRGSMITSVRKLSEKWGWSRHKTIDFLSVLDSDKMITKKSDTKKTVITIVNYGIYQDVSDAKGTAKGHRRDSKGTLGGRSGDTEGTLRDTNKNDKNVKNEKNIYARARASLPPGFENLTDEEIAMIEAERKK